MNLEEIRKLALDIAEERVFGSWMIPEDELDDTLAIVFMPLALGGEKHLPEDASVLYEYLDKSKHKTTKGYPIFVSMKVLSSVELCSLPDPWRNASECSWLKMGMRDVKLTLIWMI